MSKCYEGKKHKWAYHHDVCGCPYCEVPAKGKECEECGELKD